MACASWVEIALAIGSVLGGISVMILTLGVGLSAWNTYKGKE